MARNQLAAEALADPAWTHLLMIDGDMEWRPQDITRLIAHNLPFVAGVYACKTEPAAAVKLECVRLPGKRTDPATGLLEVDCVGAGFMLLKREVFQRLIDAYPESRISWNAGAYDVEYETLPWLYDYFPLGFQNGVYTSEDFAFCRRWRAIGGQVWADLTVRLTHYGNHAYRCDPMSLFELPREMAA